MMIDKVVAPARRKCGDDCLCSFVIPGLNALISDSKPIGSEQNGHFNAIAVNGLSLDQQMKTGRTKSISFRDSKHLQAKSASEMMKTLSFKVVGIPRDSSTMTLNKKGKGHIQITEVPSFHVVPNQNWSSDSPKFEFIGLCIVEDAHFKVEPAIGMDAIHDYLQGHGFRKDGKHNHDLLERRYRGCDTCSWGDRYSYGYNGYIEDRELKVLPALDAAVSRYHGLNQMKEKLQGMISEVYEMKDCIREYGHIQGWNWGDQDVGVCDMGMLQHRATEQTAQIAKNFLFCLDEQRFALLSCAVYKCYLQQAGLPVKQWHELKHKIPTRQVRSIHFVLTRVAPFFHQELECNLI
jgi:hypothetical protein